MKEKIEKYKQITFQGISWLNSSRLIPKLSIEELEQAIEIQKATVSLMEQELIAKIAVRTKTTQEEEKIKTKFVFNEKAQKEKEKTKREFQNMRTAFKKAGITKEMLQEMLLKMEQKSKSATIKVEESINVNNNSSEEEIEDTLKSFRQE